MTLLFRNVLSRSLGILTLFICTAVLADTTVTIPRPYATYLVDGKSYKENDADIKLSAGEHQLVIRFEGNYSSHRSIELVSGEPLVINFKTDGQEHLTFDLPLLKEVPQAKAFLKTQKLQLVDRNSKAVKSADIFELPKKEGLQIGRDYQEELLALGKAFQQPVINEDGSISANGAAAQVANGAVVTGNKNLQSLEMLKYWYNRADPQARKAFQHWIITQQ
ncbi:MAG: DUF2057 domain-containing protein [Tolumonas sp.]|nr:DUF2057 domain-containing protein [Tolumonas sp.]